MAVLLAPLCWKCSSPPGFSSLVFSELLVAAFSGKQVQVLPSLLDKSWVIRGRIPAINAWALLHQHQALGGILMRILML